MFGEIPTTFTLYKNNEHRKIYEQLKDNFIIEYKNNIKAFKFKSQIMITSIKGDKLSLERDLKHITSKFDKDRDIWKSLESFYNSKIVKQSNSILSLESQILNANSLNQQYLDEIKKINDSLVCKNTEITKLENEVYNYKNEQVRLNKEIKKQKNDIDSWSKEAQRQETISVQRKNEIDKIEKNFNNLKNESSTKINNMNTKNTEL